MIVQLLPEAIQLITQPDHAGLAGEIMARSSRLRHHPRRDSILLAVTEHDNGWREEDAVPEVDEQGVVDFVRAPLAVRHRVWPRAVARLSHDPWAAALVAQHAITVYDRFRTDHAWDTFFADMEVDRDAMLRAAAGSRADLEADYVHVRLGDLISLAFCTGWTDEHRVAEWTVRLEGSRVVVKPDPFGGDVVPIRIPARQIERHGIVSDRALREALRAAVVVQLDGEVAGSGELV